MIFYAKDTYVMPALPPVDVVCRSTLQNSHGCFEMEWRSRRKAPPVCAAAELGFNAALTIKHRITFRAVRDYPGIGRAGCRAAESLFFGVRCAERCRSKDIQQPNPTKRDIWAPASSWRSPARGARIDIVLVLSMVRNLTLPPWTPRRLLSLATAEAYVEMKLFNERSRFTAA